jgi:hypothetical protein
MKLGVMNEKLLEIRQTRPQRVTLPILLPAALTLELQKLLPITYDCGKEMAKSSDWLRRPARSTSPITMRPGNEAPTRTAMESGNTSRSKKTLANTPKSSSANLLFCSV